MPAAWNPPNRFSPVEIDWEEPPPPARIEVVEDHTQGALSHNDSPDIPFSWSVNPYRGCTHACAYCYARPTHEFLGYGAGTDFERVLVVKLRAAALLEQALRAASWKGEPICFSGVTDPYQPLERRYGLTRSCLEVCARYRNPVSIITRSPLITRDLDLLGALNEHQAVIVNISIPITDPELARLIEPGAPPPSARLRAIELLAGAGIPVGVNVAPLIPGLNDEGVAEALKLSRAAGARWAHSQLVRLPGAVGPVFEARLREALPLRADRVMRRIAEARDGALNDPRFHDRMKGHGQSWEATMQLMRLWRGRLGFEEAPKAPVPSPFRRPGEGQQQRLFG